MDTLTKKQRSCCMSRIKSKYTKPEISVRKTLFGLKIKFRMHNKKLPGKPDIIIPKIKKVIFVNGCFWHQHKNCLRQAVPKSNQKYWKNKLEKNTSRQKNDIIKLRKAGWKSYIIWECETKDENKLTKKLAKINEKNRNI